MSDSTPRYSAPDQQGAAIAVRLLADELLKIVSIAHELVEAGGTVDLTGLDRRVGLLCAKSLDLPPDDGRGVRPRLIALSGSMEALSRALTARAPRSC
jgi:hypothetical protein